MGRSSYSRKGFTIIELLMATTIMTLVISGSITIYIMSLTAWKEGSVQIALQRKASIAMEKMLRGVTGMDGIREADTVVLPNTTTIQYTSGIDSITRSFYLNGDKIMYDPDTSISGDQFCIAEKVRTSPSGLTFAVSGDIVTINLSTQEQVMDNMVTIDLSTLVNLRN